MKLSVLSAIIGAALSAHAVWALANPSSFSKVARKFPRDINTGYLLVALATGWFLYYLSLESIADFAAYKQYMYIGFSLLGALTCVFLRDFLAVRGLALVFLLFGKLVIDAARWADSSWRLLLIVWAYVLICLGMWFTVSPWRCRDMIEWCTASQARLRMMSLARLVFGLLLVALGALVF